ncbi:hypothetical protein MHBO_004804, partial [Bonamia ostreae]
EVYEILRGENDDEKSILDKIESGFIIEVIVSADRVTRKLKCELRADKSKLSKTKKEGENHSRLAQNNYKMDRFGNSKVTKGPNSDY